MAFTPLEVRTIDPLAPVDFTSPDFEFDVPFTENHPRESDITDVAIGRTCRAESPKSLVSAEFGQCIALLIKNIASGETALMHISVPELKEGQRKMLAEFSALGGQNKILLIKGPYAMSEFRDAVEIITTCIPNAQIDVLNIDFKSETPRYWHMAYQPQTDKLKILVERIIGDEFKREIRTYHAFNPPSHASSIERTDIRTELGA